MAYSAFTSHAGGDHREVQAFKPKLLWIRIIVACNKAQLSFMHLQSRQLS